MKGWDGALEGGHFSQKGQSKQSLIVIISMRFGVLEGSAGRRDSLRWRWQGCRDQAPETWLATLRIRFGENTCSDFSSWHGPLCREMGWLGTCALFSPKCYFLDFSSRILTEVIWRHFICSHKMFVNAYNSVSDLPIRSFLAVVRSCVTCAVKRM